MSWFFVCLIAVSLPSFAGTPGNVGVSGGDEGIRSFRLSVGEYYHVPERAVAAVHKQGIHDEELPVVFFIAKKAHVSPEAVVALRLKGMKWMDITSHYSLSPGIYYIPLSKAPPYGHAYRYYKKHPKGGWKKGALRDADIVNQVNLKFISEHHRYAPEKVMTYRAHGKSFTTIARDIGLGKKGKARYQAQQTNKPGDYKPDNKQKDTGIQGKSPGKGNG